MPVSSIETQMVIRVTITDTLGNLIRRYKARGEGRAFIAIWGYGGDAWRKSNILALKDAMTSLKAQMKAEEPWLRERLKRL